MSTAKRGERGLSIEVSAVITERPDELQDIVAYAFSQGGALLDKQSLDKEGNAKLSIPVGKEPQAVRVVLGSSQTRNCSTLVSCFAAVASTATLPCARTWIAFHRSPSRWAPSGGGTGSGAVAWSTARF